MNGRGFRGGTPAQRAALRTLGTKRKNFLSQRAQIVEWSRYKQVEDYGYTCDFVSPYTKTERDTPLRVRLSPLQGRPECWRYVTSARATGLSSRFTVVAASTSAGCGGAST